MAPLGCAYSTLIAIVPHLRFPFYVPFFLRNEDIVEMGIDETSRSKKWSRGTNAASGFLLCLTTPPL
jgi:hypothetical protein